MIRGILIFLSFIPGTVRVSAMTNQDLADVPDRLVFRVDEGQFKCSVNASEDGFSIRISKETAGEWIRQSRYFMRANYYEGIETLDWNEDGFEDIRVKFIDGCRPEYQNFLFLYDSIAKQFRNVEKYWWYCGSDGDPVRVTGTPGYYYNFTCWGCEGNEYESQLFRVVDYKIVVAGSMHINFCEEPYEVTIFRHHGKHNEASEKIATIPGAYINEAYDSDDFSPAWERYCINFWRKHHNRVLD
jgi:hypothetical protein